VADQTFWGFHAKGSKPEAILLDKCELAIGWGEIGDIAAIAGDRELLKAKLSTVLTSSKPGAIPVIAGQLYRFVNELAVGDVVVFRSRSEGQVRLGKVTGPYHFDPTGDPEHPNRRPVKWVKAVPITSVSQGALYELGSVLTFFQIRNYADEWQATLVGAQADTVAVETDETVAIVSEATEQNTRDFIHKRLAKELKGHPFTHFVAHLLNTMGYRTRVSPEGTDGGIDIVAHKDELGFEPPIVKVQVKSGEGKVGGPTVAELIGNLGPTEFGLFVTLGYFTPQALQKAKTNVRLIEGDELIDLILAHYEELDSRYKSLIPLKRMYVPQPLPED
jgi:restriction system protein